MTKGKRLTETRNKRFLKELLLLYFFMIFAMACVGIVLVRAISTHDAFLAVIAVFTYLLAKDYSEFLQAWIKKHEPTRTPSRSFKRDLTGLSLDLPLEGEKPE